VDESPDALGSAAAERRREVISELPPSTCSNAINALSHETNKTESLRLRKA
jgi:hypothetical protein